MSKKIVPASFENVLSNVCESVKDAIKANCGTDYTKKKEESAINIMQKRGIVYQSNPVIEANVGHSPERKTIGNNVFWTIFDGSSIESIKKYVKEELNRKFDKNVSFVLKKDAIVYTKDSIFPIDEELCFRFLSESKTDKNPNPEKGFESIGRRVNGKKMELFLNPLRFPQGITLRILK